MSSVSLNCASSAASNVSTSSWKVGSELFELDSRFTVLNYLGEGAYGMVCSVYDKGSLEHYAIKKCKNIFQSKVVAKRTVREIKLLSIMAHPNIVQLKTMVLPNQTLDTVISSSVQAECDSMDGQRGECVRYEEKFAALLRSFDSVYLVLELLDTDLSSIIKSKDSIPLTEAHIQYFVIQIVRGLHYLHSNGILHRDLKPRNIFVNANCDVKLGDFGLARVYNSSNDSKIAAMTEYVTTRWYRAPEVLAGWSRYSGALDMWAVGAITAELYGRAPMMPANDSMQQMEMIVKTFGKPPAEFITSCRKLSYRRMLKEFNPLQPCTLNQKYPTASDAAIDFMYSCMKYMPGDRITASASINHAFISKWSADVEESASNLTMEHKIHDSVLAQTFSFESSEKTSSEQIYHMLRCEILSELVKFHPSVRVPFDLKSDEHAKGGKLFDSVSSQSGDFSSSKPEYDSRGQLSAMDRNSFQKEEPKTLICVDAPQDAFQTFQSAQAEGKCTIRMKRSSTVPIEGSSNCMSLDPIPLPLIKQTNFHRRPKSVTLLQAPSRDMPGARSTKTKTEVTQPPLQTRESCGPVVEFNENVENIQNSNTNIQSINIFGAPQTAPIVGASSCLPQFCTAEKMDDDITMYSPMESTSAKMVRLRGEEIILDRNTSSCTTF